MEVTIILLVLIALGIIAYFWFRKKPSSRLDKLWVDCQRQLRMPPEQANNVIERYISRLQEKHPGRSQEWYLEKILYDLERDR